MKRLLFDSTALLVGDEVAEVFLDDHVHVARSGTAARAAGWTRRVRAAGAGDGLLTTTSSVVVSASPCTEEEPDDPAVAVLMRARISDDELSPRVLAGHQAAFDVDAA